MGVEKRKSKRIAISVKIVLTQLGNETSNKDTKSDVDVNVINISEGGIAFESEYNFEVNSYYNTVITLDNKDSIETVIEILRKEDSGNGEITYGCRFIVINPENKFKIDVYRIVSESKTE